jgi:light-regulated signal transduction histidine kinase (bacteriophytochrome)
LGEALERKFEHLAYQARDIDDCAMEPIARCGAIQLFGLLMVVDAGSRGFIVKLSPRRNFRRGPK